MAKVKSSCVGRGLNKDGTGKYFIVGALDSLPVSDDLTTFAFIVYWDGNDGEAFKQSFTLIDDAGKVLDATPEMDYVLNKESGNIGAAYFDATLRRAGQHFIRVYQNGELIETVPVNVV